MRKILFINWIVNMCSFTIYYIIKTFVLWQITNPFAYILSIPYLSPCDLGEFLLYVSCWQLFQIFIIAINQATKTNESTQKS